MIRALVFGPSDPDLDRSDVWAMWRLKWFRRFYHRKDCGCSKGPFNLCWVLYAYECPKDHAEFRRTSGVSTE